MSADGPSLSRQPVDWSAIGRAAAAAEKPATDPLVNSDIAFGPDAPFAVEGTASAVRIIRQRRSAVSFDPRKSFLSLDKFRTMLELTIPRGDAAPFGLAIAPTAVNLLLFVHRITDLDPGLYLLLRAEGQCESFRPAWRSEFDWERVWPDFSLWRLQQADLTYAAMETSCHQQIAGSSAFAVAMLADFEAVLKSAPYRYRHLHWECGMIGQVLYLAAEAFGLRGTGIGCFFDDAVHQLLGIDSMAWQDLYHFTVGYPIEDPRLTTLPGYYHLKR